MDKQERPTKDQIESYWSSFILWFWILLMTKVIATAIVKSGQTTDYFMDERGFSMEVTIAFNLAIQLVQVALFVFNMGYAAYRISGEKKQMWKGAWGLFWFIYIGPIVGYFDVKHLKNKALKALETQEQKVIQN